MNDQELDNFIEAMRPAMRQAGELAVKYQGKVENIGKAAEELPGDSDAIRQTRAAKTIIDDQAQEMLLQAAAKVLPAQEVYLDAEEDTPSKQLFSIEPTGLTLVIDPIDGTIEYLAGGNGFNIAVGLIKGGAVLTSLVYFPARDEFYFIKQNSAYLEKNNVREKLRAPSSRNDYNVYINSRVGREITEKLIRQGFALVDNVSGIASYADALLRCRKGEFTAGIFHTPQIRDVLVGAIISKTTGGLAHDWQGNPLVWPAGGRIDRAVFGFEPLPKIIINSLKY